MTKAELIERVHKDAGDRLSKKQVAAVIESTFEHMYKSIRREKRFSYPGFGTWSVKHRKARKGRNPRTGEMITIAPTKTVQFKPSPNFKAKL